MKTRYVLFLTLLTASGIVLPLRAQVVNDSATRSLSNVTNTFTGDVIVGTNGSFTLLVLSNNALLTNSANGVISLNGTATSNEVRLVSGSARWLMGGTLRVGSNGSFSTLVVSNGAFVRANSGSLGTRAGSGSNVVLVTGSGSLWSNLGSLPGTDLLVGGGGSGNQMIVSNGGRVLGNSGGIVGNNAGASNNLARITGSGSVWSNAFNVRVGFNGTANRLVIEAGGSVHGDAGTVGDFGSASNNEAVVTGPGSLWANRSSLTIGSQAGRNGLVVSNGATVWSGSGLMGGVLAASNNQVVVTGTGSVWSNQTFLFLGGSSIGNRVDVSGGGWLACNDGSVGQAFTANNNRVVLSGSGSGWNNLGSLTVGDGGNGNVLIASNGAAVLSSNATIGALGGTANNNLALITGAGSLWSNRNDLVVGNAGVGNRLVASNGGTVVAGDVFVGFSSLSANNRVTVDGGTLRVTNAAGNGTLDVRRGTNILNAGLIEADRLLVTNTLGRLVFNSGTLAVGQLTIANGQSFDLGDGVNPATLHLTGDGTHSFSSTLVVRPSATLMGNGTILAPVFLQNGTTLSPGAAPGAVGRLASSGSVSLASTSIMEISKSGSVLTNDQLQVAGALTYLRALTVSHLGPDALTAGDRFQLFPAGSYAGSFVILTLPPLNPGLRWLNNLLVDGSIEVESLAPFVQTLPASALTQTSATFNGVANPKDTSTTAWFEHGFTTNYGNVTSPQALGSGNADTNFSKAITDLIPSVVYHFRAVASNSFGVTFGADESFPKFAQRDYLKASNAGQNHRFGGAIAMDGDTLVVGAESESNGLITGGAAYVFVRSGDSWVQQARLRASNVGQNDNFGASVGISGNTIVIGAPHEESNATGVNGNQNDNSLDSAGAAYVFVRTGTNWSQQAYLKAADVIGNCDLRFCTGCLCIRGDSFGTSVAVSGDTIVVGAPFDDSTASGVNGNSADNSTTNSGAAYIFGRNGTTWVQEAYLKASNTGFSDLFGFSVAMSGGIVVVGARDEGSSATGVNGNQSDNSAPGAGAAYVFERSIAFPNPWVQTAYLKASNSEANDFFGDSVAASGSTVVVGAMGEDSGATGVNGDQNNNNAPSSGAAYVFVRGGTPVFPTWTQQAYLKASNTDSSDSFGGAVALSGDTIVIGAQFEDSNATAINGDDSNNLTPFSGAAYQFKRSGTAWSFQNYIKASNTDSNDTFGASVAVSGEFIVVGADGESSNAREINGDQNNNGAVGSGAAYVFGPPRPPFAEIAVLLAGVNVIDGGSVPQIVAAVGNPSFVNFSIRNTGNGELTGLTVSFDGPDAAMFSVVANPQVPLAPTSNTTFTVRFAPTNPGTNTATLHIASNDEDENPFDIVLSGLSLSFTQDRDGDGLNDASELLMASLGFNFQVSQTSFVNTLFNNANGAGLFTAPQLQALNVDTPLLAKDPLTGLFKLTIGVEKATLLTNFFPFPMTAPQTIINAEGKLEFQFSTLDNAAFFRLEAQ